MSLADWWSLGNKELAAVRAELAEAREREARLIEANASLVQTNALLASERRGPQAAARPEITVRQLFAAFKKAHKHRHSWDQCEDRLTPLVRRLGDVPAVDLGPVAWAEHFGARSEERDYRGNFPAPQTLKLELGRAKEMLSWGKRARLVTDNGLADVKSESVVSKRETWLERDAVGRLLSGCSAIRDLRNRLITEAFILCLNDGMLRFNEARLLRHDQIDKGGTFTLSYRTVKGKRDRIVTLTPPALAAIARIPRLLGNPFVFGKPETRNPWSEGSLRLWFNSAAAESKIHEFAVPGERVVPHTLRHSGASQADARGAPALMLRDGLGHASLRTTERYLHHEKKLSARKLAQLMLKGIDDSPSESEEKKTR